MINKKDRFINNTLISLKRQYSKDETVAALSKQLKIKEIENGKLASEIEYLEHQLKNVTNKKEEDKAARIEHRKCKMNIQIINENIKLLKEVKSLRKLRTELYSKINILKTNNND